MSGKTVFITGATGYIGLVTASKAIAAGYKVRGLSRNPEKDAALSTLGAEVVRGDVGEHELLTREAAAATGGVLHLAFNHDWSQPMDQVLKSNEDAVAALAAGLQKSASKIPLVFASVTAPVRPDPTGAETFEDAPVNETFAPFNGRLYSERAMLDKWTAAGLPIVAIRLPPFVYGRGGSGFLPRLLARSAEMERTIYLERTTRTSTGHVDDIAQLFVQTLLKQDTAAIVPGAIFNAVTSTDVTAEQIARAVAQILAVPAVRVSDADARADSAWGPFLYGFITNENRASGAKARTDLAWSPAGPAFLDDITTGSYVAVADALKAKNKQ